jgi:hypothetical protein
MTANTFALKAIASRITASEKLPHEFDVGSHKLKLMIKKPLAGGFVYRYIVRGIQLVVDILEKDDALNFVIVKDPMEESNSVSKQPKSDDLDDLKTLIAELIHEHTCRFNS